MDSRTCWILVFLGLAWVWRWSAWAAGVEGQDDPRRRYLVTWYGLEEGLPGGGATAMVHAKDGYLWFGTFSGLGRFDGLGFEAYTPMNVPEMPSHGVTGAHRDREGALWFGLNGGMLRWTDGRWRWLGRDEGWTTDHARTVSEGRDGTLYVTGYDGKVLRWTGKRFEELSGVPGSALGGFGHCDPEGRFWLANLGFVGFWDGMRWHNRTPPGWVSPGAQPFMGGGAQDGRFWVLRRDRAWKLDVQGVVRDLVFDRELGEMWAVHEDREGALWVSSPTEGLFYVLPRRGDSLGSVATVTHLTHAGGQSFGGVRFVREDAEGNLWMGTPSDGLARWTRKPFRVVETDEGLPLSHYRSATVDAAGCLWTGSYNGGVYRRDAPGGDGRFRELGYDNLPSPDSVLADRMGRVWATGLGLGQPVFRLEGARAWEVYRDGDEQGTRSGIFEDSGGAPVDRRTQGLAVP